MRFLSLFVIFASPWKLRKAGVYDEVQLFPNGSLVQLAGHVRPSLNARLAPGQIFALLIALSVHIFGLFEHLCEISFQWKCGAPL